jgi:HAD superfamily hydrolase (TIGR01549 family)
LTTPQAVTFDFWSTLFTPGPEVMRLRASVLAPVLGAPEDAVLAALVAGFDRHSAEWRAGRCLALHEIAADLATRFVPDHDPAWVADLTELIEESALDGGERLVEGAAETLAELRGAGIRLGVISDTSFSPGRVLRRLLERAGVLGCFVPAALTFSDEVGVPKPHPRIFATALAALDVGPAEAAHIGDLRFTDVAGGRAAGLRTVRFRGCYDDRSEGPEADVVVSRMAEVPAALGLSSRP